MSREPPPLPYLCAPPFPLINPLSSLPLPPPLPNQTSGRGVVAADGRCRTLDPRHKGAAWVVIGSRGVCGRWDGRWMDTGEPPTRPRRNSIDLRAPARRPSKSPRPVWGNNPAQRRARVWPRGTLDAQQRSLCAASRKGLNRRERVWPRGTRPPKKNQTRNKQDAKQQTRMKNPNGTSAPPSGERRAPSAEACCALSAEG